MVTSVDAAATRVGVATLERGGNAVDAAIATALVLAVTQPSAGNLGGGGFALVRRAEETTVAVDFRETAPQGLTAARFAAMLGADARGADAVGVPGSVAGLALLHRRFGSLPWATLVTPALDLARRGHLLGAREAAAVARAWRYLKRDAVLARVYGAKGRAAPAGARVKQPELARVLERIRDQGEAGFYAGATADELVRDVARAGGSLALTDLTAYRAVEREPLELDYRGVTVQVMPPPSAGGVVVAGALLLLQREGAWKYGAGSADELQLFLEASRRGQAERRLGVVDPDALTPGALAERRARWLDRAVASVAGPIDLLHATPSSAVSPLYDAALAAESEHTTHLSVADRTGLVISLTTTLSSGFGAGISASGVVLNNSVASFSTVGENRAVAGRRTVSSMAPTLVLRGGRVVFVLGSPGGDTIPSTVVQVLRNLVDHDLPLDEAVDAPRVHHGFVPDELRFEGARPIARTVLAELERRGHRVSKKRIPMGDANVIAVLADQAFAYADPREGGLALAARK